MKQKYQESNPRYRIYMNKKNHFFRVNLQLLKLQLPLQLSYLQLNYCISAVHIIFINNSFSNNNNVFYNTWAEGWNQIKRWRTTVHRHTVIWICLGDKGKIYTKVLDVYIHFVSPITDILANLVHWPKIAGNAGRHWRETFFKAVKVYKRQTGELLSTCS